MTRFARLALAVAALSLAAASAHADYSIKSQIQYLGVVANDPANPDFRVMPFSVTNPGFTNTDPLCGPGTPSWAYASTADANFAMTANVLRDAKAQFHTVEIFTVPVTFGSPPATYCKITYVRIF